MTLSPMCNVLMVGRRPGTVDFLSIFLENPSFFVKINARILRDGFSTMRKTPCELYKYKRVAFNVVHLITTEKTWLEE